MSDFVIPASDNGANALFEQFKNAMTIYAFDLGYDAVAIDDATAAYTDFHGDLTTVTNAKAALKAAVSDKDAQRATSSTVVRAYAQQIKNNPLATNEIKNAFGINTSSTSNPPVQIPTALSATPSATGTARLKWSKNGNIRGTVYLVETKNGSTWSLHGTTTKSSFTDATATPGVQKTYRVRAQRASITSGPSNEAVIYSGGEGFGGLELAA